MRLPARTPTQIRGMVLRLKLKKNSSNYVKQPATEWIDAAIMRAYRNASERPNVIALSKSLNRSPGWIKWRAQVLGVARYNVGGFGKGSIWSPEEDALLDQCLESSLSISGIYSKMKRAGYYRSYGAIHSRIATRGLSIQRDWWTATETGKALAVNMKVVTRWIENGALKATRVNGPTVTPEVSTLPTLWKIELRDLRRFLIANPRAWDHRRVAIEILLELLCSSECGIGAFANGHSARRVDHAA